MSLAATLATSEVANRISAGEPGVFMHGPTFMANPLACAVAAASIDLLLASPWQTSVARIEAGLREALLPLAKFDAVQAVRVLGAIGVVELHHPVDMHSMPRQFVELGVWIRPFGRLVYVMPPYIISAQELRTVTSAIATVIAGLQRTD
jgi:adenosylmethionine-8-amino-7-oxononanoate aminotransferase